MTNNDGPGGKKTLSAAGVLIKFHKKGFLSPPMLHVEGDTVKGGDKTYLFEKNPDPDLIKKLSEKQEGVMIRIQYYHFNEANDVRVIVGLG